MTLTEQWKKGELEWDREYYVDLENNGIVKQLYLDEDGCFFDGIIDYSLKNKPYMEVLAPVPSYEEWKAQQNYEEYQKKCISIYESKEKQATETSIAYNELAEENAQLKELLKECFDWFTWYQIDVTTGRPYIETWQKKGRDLRSKIDNAIGEKK